MNGKINCESLGVSGDNEIKLLFAKMEVLHGDWLQTAWDMI